MRGIYEARQGDGLSSHGMHAKFHEDRLRQSKVIEGIHRQHGNTISLLS
jgi:hypothetical protein